MKHALPRRRTRVLVLTLVAVMLGLAALATVVILNGWNDEDLQEHIESLDE